MIQDAQKWNLGVSKLGAFMQYLRSPTDEQRVEQFHSILAILQEASGEDLSAFTIPPEKLAPRTINARRGGYGGGAGSSTFSKERYCDDAYFQSQVHGLANYIATIRKASSAIIDDKHPMERPSSTIAPGWKSAPPLRAEETARTVPVVPLVLISHSSKDKGLAEALIDLLRSGSSRSRRDMERMEKALASDGRSSGVGRADGGWTDDATSLGASTGRAIASAQADRPSFDVASIKPNRSGVGTLARRQQPGGRYAATNITLNGLITVAYPS